MFKIIALNKKSFKIDVNGDFPDVTIGLEIHNQTMSTAKKILILCEILLDELADSRKQDLGY